MFFRRPTKVTSATGAAELLSGIRFLFVFDVSGVYKKVTYDTADTLSVFFFMLHVFGDSRRADTAGGTALLGIRFPRPAHTRVVNTSKVILALSWFLRRRCCRRQRLSGRRTN